MKAYIRTRIAAGRTKRRSSTSSSRQLGNGACSASRGSTASTCSRGCCRSSGSRSARVALAAGAWCWSRNRAADGWRSRRRRRGPPLDPELERRVDEELARFDGLRSSRSRSSPGSSLCHPVRPAARARLPLGRLGGRRRPARRARGRAAGRAREHAVHRRLHGRVRRARRRRGGDRERRRRSRRQTQIAGFALDRDRARVRRPAAAGRSGAVAPGPAAARARAGAPRLLLGGAFAVCAAPCIGTVLASILVLAELERRRSRAASSCCSPTRSGSAPRSCSPASRSRTRCARSAGCARTTS